MWSQGIVLQYASAPRVNPKKDLMHAACEVQGVAIINERPVPTRRCILGIPIGIYDFYKLMG